MRLLLEHFVDENIHDKDNKLIIMISRALDFV